MLHILNAVQMTIDVEVAVFDDIRDSFRIILHGRNLSRLFDRAGTVGDVGAQPGDVQQGRPTCLHIDSRPDGTGKAECFTFAIHQFETTAGK